MKYTKEFKLKCIRKYKNGEYIEDPPGLRHKAFREYLARWVKTYDSLGEAGLEHRRPTLNINQRLELIKRIESGESYRQVAYSAGIQAELLIKWHDIYLESGIDGLKSLKRGKQPMNKKRPVKKADSKKTKEELLEELE